MDRRYKLRRQSLQTLSRNGKLTTEPKTGQGRRYRAFRRDTPLLPAPVNMLTDTAHKELSQYEDENVGLKSVHQAEQLAERGGNLLRSAGYAAQLRRESLSDEAAGAESAVEGTSPQSGAEGVSNPLSKRRQKQEIKSQYLAQRTASSTAPSTTATTAKGVEKTAEGATLLLNKVQYAVAEKGGTLLAVLFLAAMVFLMVSGFSSCIAMLPGTVSSVVASTYPSGDEDMLAAEAQYCALEAELQVYLDSYESIHSYDEYIFELDEISHDPYVLISALTALMDGNAWTIDGVQTLIQALFDQQYILTEEVTTETRTRTETVTTVDEDGNEYETEEEVAYTYTVCTVTLENFDLSHLPAYVMTEAQLSLYSLYLSVLGNRADLFPDSEYIAKYITTVYTVYEILPEALTDEKFANMIAEAEKYLGYPYVWGGSSPSTSFDCSGFVSWVINNCGNGWSVGRLSANGLLNICTVVSAAEVQPGDLVFFQGTYQTTGASHVGIYVGNGMMLHCGDPIQYTSIQTSYWQSHFLCYGRLS